MTCSVPRTPLRAQPGCPLCAFSGPHCLLGLLSVLVPTPHALPGFSQEDALITSAQNLASESTSGRNLRQVGEEAGLSLKRAFRGNVVRQDQGSGCQLSQEAWRQRQMGRAVLRP